MIEMDATILTLFKYVGPWEWSKLAHLHQRIYDAPSKYNLRDAIVKTNISASKALNRFNGQEMCMWLRKRELGKSIINALLDYNGVDLLWKTLPERSMTEVIRVLVGCAKFGDILSMQRIINTYLKKRTDAKSYDLLIVEASIIGNRPEVLVWFNKHVGFSSHFTEYYIERVFTLAVEFNRLTILKWLTERFNLFVQIINMWGEKALIIASSNGYWGIVEWITETYCYNRDRLFYDSCILIPAGKEDQLHIVRNLIEKLNLGDEYVADSWFWAATHNRIWFFKWADQRFNLRNDGDILPWNASCNAAAYNENREALEWLIERFKLTRRDVEDILSILIPDILHAGNLGIARRLIEQFQLTPDDIIRYGTGMCKMQWYVAKHTNKRPEFVTWLRDFLEKF